MNNRISEPAILARHRRTLRGTLTARRVHSQALGLRKPFFVYEPPPAPGQTALPVLYLFRGHQREWVNMREDTSRRTSTAVEDLDTLISRGELPPLVAVMPGLNSANNHVPSLGIDMEGRWNGQAKGLGRGRFWQYLTGELIPTVEARYPQTAGGLRLMAGFSLGGYTASLLALRFPGYFHHVGLYDGTLAWPAFLDPRRRRTMHPEDVVWCHHPLFNAALGRAPRRPDRMQRWNPTDVLLHADGPLLESLRKTTFWVASANADRQRGNRDRSRFFNQLLQQKGIPTGYDEVVFAPGAAHNWHWTDRFLIDFLRGAFR